MAIDWADVNETVLRYELSGRGPRVLVLLHEMGGTLESWDHVVPALAMRCRVLRFDMRGAGLSQKIVGSVALDDLVADLTGLLDHLGLTGPLMLAGCAVGAAVAIRFATAWPDRVETLLVMSPALGILPERRAHGLERADAVEREGMRAMTMAGHDRAYPLELRHDAARERAARSLKLGNDPHSFAAIQRMLADLDMSADLAALSCRCLFLGGALDGTRPPAQVEAIARQVRGAQYETVRSGHGMSYLTPELVVERLIGFNAL